MKRSWWVYILKCVDGSLYTGITNDLERRIAAHNAGRGAAYTKSHRPVTLVWKKRAMTRSTALKREAAIKKLARKEKLSLISSN
jgi:putative endonuclease